MVGDCCQYLIGGNLLFFPLTTCSFSSFFFSHPDPAPWAELWGFIVEGHVLRSWGLGLFFFIKTSLVNSPSLPAGSWRAESVFRRSRAPAIPLMLLPCLTPYPPPCEASVSESSVLGQHFCILLSSEEFRERK